MNRAMAVVTFSDAAAQDGIHRDGSYLQHDGILCAFAKLAAARRALGI